MVDAAVEFFLLKMIRAGKLSLTAITGSDNSASFINSCKEVIPNERVMYVEDRAW
jgi:hypothetical protein